jgi:Fe-S cluster assembly protein SufB
MSKYTEDDLKIELETKEYEYGFYRIRIGYISYWQTKISFVLSRSEREEPQWMTDWRLELFVGRNDRTRMG